MSYPSFEAALVQSGIIVEPDPRPAFTLSEALEAVRALEGRYRAARARWQLGLVLEPESED